MIDQVFEADGCAGEWPGVGAAIDEAVDLTRRWPGRLVVDVCEGV